MTNAMTTCYLMATFRQTVRLWYAKAMQKSFKDLPDFATEDEERAFWATHDSTDYIDWSTAVVAVFPQLKRTNMLSADSGNELNGFTADHPFPK